MTLPFPFLAAQGVTRFIEVGPGGELTGLLRALDPSLEGVRFGEAEDLEKIKPRGFPPGLEGD
jgi:malonyl CoA-acyl carrier protein transacylase